MGDRFVAVLVEVSDGDVMQRQDFSVGAWESGVVMLAASGAFAVAVVMQQLYPGRPVKCRTGRKIRARIKRFAFRGEKTIEGPAAAAGEYLASLHINGVHIRTFFPVHFDIDKVLVHKLRNVLIFK